jgi:ATP-dependent Clp protease ATP-binding subunit ClpC
MFEHLGDRARRSVVLAQEAARTLGHDSIGTDHWLIGLMQAKDSTAGKALGYENIDLTLVRQRVGGTALYLPNAPVGHHVAPSPEFRTVLELAQQMAAELGESTIGTEHILLVLTRQTEGAAAQVLISLGADLGRIRQRVVKLNAELIADAGPDGESAPGSL